MVDLLQNLAPVAPTATAERLRNLLEICGQVIVATLVLSCWDCQSLFSATERQSGQ